jgi:hypothetical protein
MARTKDLTIRWDGFQPGNLWFFMATKITNACKMDVLPIPVVS